MNMRVTLRLWKKYKEEHKKRVQDHAKKGEMNYESSFEESLEAPAVLQISNIEKEQMIRHPKVDVAAIKHLDSKTMVNPQDCASANPS